MHKLMFLSFVLILNTSISHADTFEISITNTSNRDGFGGQNVSGPALLIHNSSFDLFKIGRPASKALWEIAEDGDTSTALALSRTERGVVSTHKLTRIPRKQAFPSINHFTIADSRGVLFSLAGMLTTTNDGFAGVDAEKLPTRVGDVVRYELRAWDAGSEENNEMCPFVPCEEHYNRKPEGAEGAVMPHKGLKGIGDIDRIDRGWPSDNIVGVVQIMRVN